MIQNGKTYSISIEELATAFMALPVNADRRLRFIALSLPLQTSDISLDNYQLQFDWNDAHNDWELSQGPELVITTDGYSM